MEFRTNMLIAAAFFATAAGLASAVYALIYWIKIRPKSHNSALDGNNLNSTGYKKHFIRQMSGNGDKELGGRGDKPKATHPFFIMSYTSKFRKDEDNSKC